MKRRNFINGIAALAGTVLLAPVIAKASETKEAYLAELQKELILFNRFYRQATGYGPYTHQMKWFHAFYDAKRNIKTSAPIHEFLGFRQTGMTLFMMVLAAYESKVHGKSTYIMPLNWTNQRLMQLRYADIERNVGKSVLDGKVHIGQWYVNEETVVCDYEFHPDSNHHFKKMKCSFGKQLFTFNTTGINKIKTT